MNIKQSENNLASDKKILTYAIITITLLTIIVVGFGYYYDDTQIMKRSIKNRDSKQLVLCLTSRPIGESKIEPALCISAFKMLSEGQKTEVLTSILKRRDATLLSILINCNIQIENPNLIFEAMANDEKLLRLAYIDGDDDKKQWAQLFKPTARTISTDVNLCNKSSAFLKSSTPYKEEFKEAIHCANRLIKFKYDILILSSLPEKAQAAKDCALQFYCAMLSKFKSRQSLLESIESCNIMRHFDAIMDQAKYVRSLGTSPTLNERAISAEKGIQAAAYRLNQYKTNINTFKESDEERQKALTYFRVASSLIIAANEGNTIAQNGIERNYRNIQTDSTIQGALLHVLIEKRDMAAEELQTAKKNLNEYNNACKAFDSSIRAIGVILQYDN